MYIYHYYAIKQLAPGSVSHMDGLIERDTPLSGEREEYKQLKKEIEDFSLGEVTGGLTICSLTLLSHKEKPNE